MNTIKKYAIDLDLEDGQGWKWGGHMAIWACSLEVADQAGRSYMDHVNALGNGEKITDYHAYEMTEMVGA